MGPSYYCCGQLLLKQGAHFPKVVLKYLDFEYFDDKDYARIRELATEDFDYEAHLDLLER